MRAGISFLILTILAAAVQANELVPKQYEVRGRFVVIEKKEQTVIAIPPLTVLEGKQAEYGSGGTLSTSGSPLRSGVSGVPHGLSLAITLHEAADEVRMQ